MHSDKQIPIWFFIGLLLSVYGLLILASAVYGVLNPPPVEARVKLWHLHADLWWSLLLILVGLLYTVRFRPRKGDQPKAS